MAYSYSEGCGVLFLKNVTPVIKALFAEHCLNGEGGTDNVGEGMAYIAESHERGYYTGRELLNERLRDLVDELGLQPPQDAEDICATLRGLAEHYQTGEAMNAWIQCNQKDIDTYQIGWINDLFDLAQMLDDGHGLTGFSLEKASVCSELRLGDFYGRAWLVTPAYQAYVDSDAEMREANNISAALLANDTLGAADQVLKQVQRVLSSILDDQQRDAITAIVRQGL